MDEDNSDSRKASDKPKHHFSTDDLVQELLVERRKDRRAGLLKTGLFALVILGYAAWMVLMTLPAFSAGVSPQEPFAAVVKVSGLIADGKPASYDKLAPVLRRAFKDPNSRGVVLHINSPGGTPVQASLIHDLIVELKEETGKPVIAVGEDMMTSGAYLIAVAADTLVANRSSIVGSIGVVSSGFGFSELIDRLGIERRIMTAGNSKSMLDPFQPVKDEDLETRQELLATIHEHFKEIVIDGRAERLDVAAPGMFEGMVWTGEQAMAVGLIDEIGRVDTAIRKHLKVNRAHPYAPREPLLQSILGNITASFGAQVASELENRLTANVPVKALAH